MSIYARMHSGLTFVPDAHFHIIKTVSLKLSLLSFQKIFKYIVSSYTAYYAKRFMLHKINTTVFKNKVLQMLLWIISL